MSRNVLPASKGDAVLVQHLSAHHLKRKARETKVAQINVNHMGNDMGNGVVQWICESCCPKSRKIQMQGPMFCRC